LVGPQIEAVKLYRHATYSIGGEASA
jgi:hypothetical protein